MHAIGPSLLLLLSILGAPEGLRPPEEEQVRALIGSQIAAWNRGDLDAFCAPYAEDALFVTPKGTTRGRGAVRDRYERKYGRDRSGMGTLAIEPIEVRTFGREGDPAGARASAQATSVVTVAATWSLAWKDRPPSRGYTLIVFRRRNGAWELVQDASM